MAAYYWIGGFTDHETDPAYTENWYADGGAEHSPQSWDDVIIEAVGATPVMYDCILAGAESTMTWKSLTINSSFTKDFDTAGFPLDILGDVYINNTGNVSFGASEISATGSWTFGTNTTVDTETSTVTLSGGANCTITSNGKSFYDIVIAKDSNSYTVTLADALACHTLTRNGTGATGVFTAVTYSITSSSTISLGGTGSITLDNVTITGDGNFVIADSPYSLTLTYCDLVLQGTGSLSVVALYQDFASITVGNTGKTTTLSLQLSCNVLNLGAGTFTLNANLYIRAAAAGAAITTQTGYTINGGMRILIGSLSTGYTTTVPALTLGGDLSLAIYNLWFGVGTWTIEFTGNLTIPGNFIIGLGRVATTQLMVVNFDSGLTVTNGSSGNGFLLNPDVNGATAGVVVVNMNNVNFTTIYFNYSYLDYHSTGFTINFQSCTFNCLYNFYLFTDLVCDFGTSSIVFDRSNHSTIISAGKTLYAVTVNKSSNTYTLTLGDALSCNTMTITVGNFTASTSDYSITAVAGIALNSSGTYRLGACLITGDGSFNIISSAGDLTLTNCTIEMRGTGNFDIDKASLTFVSVKFNAAGKTISSTGGADWTTGRWYVEPDTTVVMQAGRTITVSSYTTGDIDGTSGHTVILQSSSAGSWWYFNNPAGMTANYVNVKDSNATNSINSVNCTDSGHNINWFASLAALIPFLLLLRKAEAL